MKHILTENMRRFGTKNLNESFQGESMPKKEKIIKKDGQPIPYYSTTVKVQPKTSPDGRMAKGTELDDRRRIFFTQIKDVEFGKGKFTESDVLKFARGKAGNIPTMDEFQDILMPNRTKSVKMGFTWVKLDNGQLTLESLDGQGGGVGAPGANNIVLISGKLAKPIDGFDDDNLKMDRGGNI